MCGRNLYQAKKQAATAEGPPSLLYPELLVANHGSTFGAFLSG